MASNAVVRARIEETLKRQASAVLAGMGLTVSDAMRMLLTRVALEKGLPFDPIPNALTALTLDRSARGEDLHRPADAASLFRDLGM